VVVRVASLEERLAVLSPHLYDAVPLTVAGKGAGVSLRTAQRWLTSYRADGATALVRSGRTDRGGWRIAAELVELIEGLALRRPAPQIAQVYRKVRQVCADLRMQLIHSTPGVPRGRGKGERFFGSVSTELLPTLAGHIPPGNHGRPVTPAALTLSQLDGAVGEWIVGTYLQRGHPETGQPPVQRWTAGGWLPRMPESLEALNLLLLTVRTPRKVQRDGIHLHGLRYFATTLAPYVGEAVTIRYDPRDLAEIRVYHRDEFLWRAVAPEIAAASISMQDLQAARNERRRELREHLTARRSLAELLNDPRPAIRSGARDTRIAAPPAAGAPRLKLYAED